MNRTVASKSTALLSVVSLVLQLCSPVFPVIQRINAEESITSVPTPASPSMNISWDARSNSFILNVATDKHVSYTLAYKTEDGSTQGATGSESKTPSYTSTIYAGTCSSGVCTPHAVNHGIIKVHIEQLNWFYTQGFVITPTGLSLVFEGTQTTTVSLTEDERLWLEDPTRGPPPAYITPTPTQKPVQECTTSKNATPTTTNDWTITGNTAETKDIVKLNTRYVFPLQPDVTVTFTCLPSDPAKRTTLKIQQISIRNLPIIDSFIPVGDMAYDITTGMDDGTFTYDLTLPRPPRSNPRIVYLNASSEDLKYQNPTALDVKTIDASNTVQGEESISALNINHFSIYYTVEVYSDMYITVDHNFYQGQTVYAQGTRSAASTIKLRFKNPSNSVVKTCDATTGTSTTCAYTLPTNAPVGQWIVELGRCSSDCSNSSHWDWDKAHDYFTVEKTYSISGYKWNDGNGDGTRDTKKDCHWEWWHWDCHTDYTESTLAGWTITLEKSDASITRSTTTDANGNYIFSGIPAGTYTICEIQKTGWTNTYPSGSLCQSVTITNCDKSGINFGNKEIPPQGVILLDKVTNPSGDTTAFDLEVYTFADDGSYPTVGEGMVADPDAPYAVPVAPGRYGVLERYYGSDYSLSDITCVSSITGVLPQYYDFSIQANETITCTVSNIKKGHIIIQKTTEPAGDPQTFAIRALCTGSCTMWGGNTGTISDAQDFDLAAIGGQFTIVEQIPGVLTLPEGWEQTDSIGCENITVAPGETKYCSFTNVKQGGISGIKFHDINGNGIQDAGDFGMPYWELFIDQNANGKADEHEQKVQTDMQGEYTFPNLADGSYTICETVIPGWTPTTQSGNCQTATVTGSNGATLNFGNFQYNTIMGCKYDDINGNGMRDYEPTTEAQIRDWTIRLYNSEWQLVSQTQTGALSLFDNRYYFFDVGPGRHYVCEDMREGWRQTGPTAGIYTVVNQSENRDHEGQYCYVIDSSSGATWTAKQFGNQFVNPKLTITKTNDATGDKAPGESVLFTLTITAHDSAVNGVTVVDLPAQGFSYRKGTWTAVSSIGRDLSSITVEPTYASPGSWNLGDMAAGETVTLTYLADISAEQLPGLYKDLAYTFGKSIIETDVVGNEDTGVFVGTDVNVVKSTQNNVDVTVTREEQREEKIEGQILGVQLPATGASTILLGFAGLALISGIGILILNRRRHYAQ